MWARKGDGHNVFWLINRWSHKNPWRPHRPHKPTPHSSPGPGWCWDLQGQRRCGVVGGGGWPWPLSHISPIIFSPKEHRLKLQASQKTLLQEMEVTTDHERDQENTHSERVQKMTPTRPFIAPWSLLKSKRNSNIFKCNLPSSQHSCQINFRACLNHSKVWDCSVLRSRSFWQFLHWFWNCWIGNLCVARIARVRKRSKKRIKFCRV